MSRILMVDDEEGIREFVAEALEDEGHRTTTAADGVEALARLGERSFDLMITDLKMPRLDGMELVRRVHADHPDMELVVLTAHGTVDTAVEAMKRGAYDYLQKPIGSPDELRMVVRRALERRHLLAHKEGTSRQASPLPPLGYGDPAMEPVVDALRKVAPTRATVLLRGESGTGKEIAARTIHRWSRRADGPFVVVNCAALPESLVESEVFGHEKGAFTGATSVRRGRVELADGGTLFLDEISELTPSLQAKLLRVLEEDEVQRVGGTASIHVDVRWIAATNRELEPMRAEGAFRDDLYHRLAVFPIHLPPLRERPRDIPPLTERLLEEIAADLGRPGLTLETEARDALVDREWSGNVRELRNTLERAAILTGSETVELHHLGSGSGRRAPDAGTLAELERKAIERALERVGGNRRKAAARLGIGERTLYDKLKRYDIG